MSKVDHLEKLSDETRKLAATLKTTFDANYEDGAILAPKETWEQAFKEIGVEADTVRQVEKATATVFNAARLAAGEVATERMRDDKELPRVSLSMNIGKTGKFNVDIDRSRTHRNPQTGEEVTRMGGMSAKFTQSFVGGKSGEGKMIAEHISAQATEYFG